MITIAVLLFSAAVPADLMARADAANEAFVACLFATSREANATALSVAQFESRLATRCLAEQRATQTLGARIFSLRGGGDGVVKAQRLVREARRDAVEQYRRSIALGPMIEGVAEICRVRPESCRD